ncbi:hypothetical protein JD844_034225 [Phrynosoma platyrhinos]|uniref:Deoxyhypusine hydroxylase n=1 Tax=Phrynosoma platyrhinos TaxID=52577 RepID=A0ABQ7T810_PHRPL|nr:hypothetical protein JD844_034225 [Phrynosoma platyrhinos]
MRDGLSLSQSSLTGLFHFRLLEGEKWRKKEPAILKTHFGSVRPTDERAVLTATAQAQRLLDLLHIMVTEKEVEMIGRTLVDSQQPLKDRFRALFTLRNLGGPAAIDWIGKTFADDSALLKHELAYCLGQMQDERAIPILIEVLQDIREALGAIGNPKVLDILKQYADDPVIEVAETCQLAVKRIEWLQENQDKPITGPYCSVDPAPPAEEVDVGKLRQALLDESRPLFERYRAMFALRNMGGEAAVLALADGLQCDSALFRHEIAYVLGQMQHEAGVPQLTASLESAAENPMVRHECAEALGSIAKASCLATLQTYAQDKERVVRESCEVALDMYNYENGTDFQYADGLSKLKTSD